MDGPSYPTWTDDEDDEDEDEGFGEKNASRPLTHLLERPVSVVKCSTCGKLVWSGVARRHQLNCARGRRLDLGHAESDAPRKRLLKRRLNFEDDDEYGESGSLEASDEESGGRRLKGRSMRPAAVTEADSENELLDDHRARREHEQDMASFDDEDESESMDSNPQAPLEESAEDPLDQLSPKSRRALAKSNKGKLSGRTAEPFSVDRNCGVPGPDGSVCRRSLTCKTHSMGAKRSVKGRSAPYDVLLNQWMDAHGIKRPGTAVRERAAAAARARRLEAADEDESESSDANTFSEDDLTQLPAMGFFNKTNGMDSDDDLDLILSSIRVAVKRPIPIVWPNLTTCRRAWYVQRRYAGRAARTALIAALKDSRTHFQASAGRTIGTGGGGGGAVGTTTTMMTNGTGLGITGTASEISNQMTHAGNATLTKLQANVRTNTAEQFKPG